MAAAGQVLVRTMNLLAGKVRPGRHHQGARRGRRALHPLPGRRAGVQGLPGIPRLDLRIAQLDDRSRHPGPLQARPGRHPLDRHRRDPRWLGGRCRADVRRGPGQPGRPEAAPGHRGVADGRRAAVSGRATGWATSGTPSRSTSRPRACRSSARSSVTGSGARCTRTRRSPTTARPGTGVVLEEGMVLAVEPMVTAGRHAVRVADDHWSIFSQDGSLAAHFEFTIAVTAEGPRILTPWHEKHGPQPPRGRLSRRR